MGRLRLRTNAKRAWLGLAFVLACLFDVRSASAQATSLELSWTAPSSCPDRAWIEAAVLHLVTNLPSQPLQVTGAVREEGGRWVVDLELRGAVTGRRTLSATSCGAVSRGAALIVALALDPQASASLAEEDSAQPHAPASEPPPPPVVAAIAPPPRVEPARAEPPSLRPIFFAGTSADTTLLPELRPGLMVGGGVQWRAFRVDLAVEVAWAANASLPSRSDVGADFMRAGIGLRACAGHSFPWLELGGCAAARGVRIAGEGTGVAESYRNAAYLLAFEPGVLVRIPGNTRAAIELDGAAVVPLARPDFVILSDGPSEQLFRVSVIGARLGIGASVRF
jgi:hypothetical protein